MEDNNPIEHIMLTGGRKIVKKVREKDPELAEEVALILCLMTDYLIKLDKVHDKLSIIRRYK